MSATTDNCEFYVNWELWWDISLKNLDKPWATQVKPAVEAALRTLGQRPLAKVGSFSNGEGVYREVE